MLAQMLGNGFSIKQALAFMINFLPKEKTWICQLQRQLAQGKILIQALEESHIKQELVDQIAIAQQHGQLVSSLEQLVKSLQMKAQQMTKLKGMLNYPILLGILLGGFYLAMKIYIQPQLQDFGGKTYQLPTGVIVGLITTGLLSGLLLGLFWVKWHRAPPLRRVALQCRLPVMGGIFKKYYAYLICTDLAIYLSNGLNLAEILQALQKLPPKSFLSALAKQIESQLQQGQSLDSIIKNNRILPTELLTFIHRGSDLKLLAQEMRIFSQLLFNKLIEDLNRLMLKVQPLAFMVIASLILLMYLQLLMPIYNMMGSI
ncbi:hypothetical protein FC83_GL001274 [Agrilactobacillus composti DSM 18527 = JCM 14202]|uniref:Type II secretion system protein GspF domain-containing protein n=1 Tax=Agrilactobacillus composti DSM 18527 = JCM 14202 TaxID=1423734 RepID=A0A0R1XYR0_9LACO|nr:type II secretion system F family protein [Agrilactobacillus composti]KRM35146.1 hypothetical protein FC83_GL001274 [Agrilactobacillus composti DSM 18527 = JCM 14202]